MPSLINIDELLKGHPRAIAKAITLVESTLVPDQKQAAALLASLPKRAIKPLRIGISGPPGVGKSTLLEALGLYAIEQGKRVGIVAIDPTSSLSKGSILGDKTRMAQLARHPHAFIRPQPAGEHLGGVSAGTGAAVDILAAAGFSVIFVETVGVGQSEAAVKQLVDIFVLLVQPGSGDELQWMKRGSLELADIVVVTKCDGDLASYAEKAVRGFVAMQALQSHSKAVALTVSAKTHMGIEQLWNEILAQALT